MVTKTRNRMIDGPIVFVKDYGAIGDGTDESDEIQEAINVAYETGATYLIFESDKVYGLNKAIFFNSYGVLPRGLIVVASGVTFRLLIPTIGGGIIDFGRGLNVGNGVDIERTGNISWFGGTVDGANIAGENGWACARMANVEFFNIQAINCKRDYVGTREGGRGFTAHPRCRNVTVTNYSANNCSDYIHVSHSGDYITSDSGLISITGITNATQAVITAVGHTFVVGDSIYIYNVGGMDEVNPHYAETDKHQVVVSTSSNTITLALNTSTYGTYTGGGNIIHADTTSGGKSSGINFIGGYAEDCEYSFINIEGANQPRSMRTTQTVSVIGAVGKNCGTTNTRGVINGSNAIRLMCDVTLINIAPLGQRSVVRGSFSSSDIKVRVETDTLTSIIDSTPTTENPVGTGIDAGYPSHPYGTSSDNHYDITVKFNNPVTSGISELITVDGTISGSIDLFYRNKINLTMSGLDDGIGMDTRFNNVGLHHTNNVTVYDMNIGRRFEGKLPTVRGFVGTTDSVDYAGETYHLEGVQVNGVGFSELAVGTDASGKAANIRYQHSNDRWYVYVNNVSTYQLTATAITPSVDNTNDLGSAGLRMRTIYAGTGTINTSDAREKTPMSDLTSAELLAAKHLSKVIGGYKWLASIEAKGDNARYHIGMTVQSVMEIMQSYGLNPTDYGFICYDEWAGTDEELTEDGTVMLASTPSGNRYGFRHDQLTMFIIAGINARLLDAGI